MLSESGKTKRQLMDEDEAIPLADLMESDSSLEPDYEVIEVEKPKRKRKPKPQPRLHIPLTVVVGIAAMLIGFVAAMLTVFVAPVSQSDSQIISYPNDQVIQAIPNSIPNDADPLLDRWMMLNQQVGEIPANTFVRVLSQDNTPEFYNVADMQSHLTIVLAYDLTEAASPPLPSVYPPLGPYSAALGKNQKLLVTIEWNGDMSPGTLVYAMGWRAEDGTWIYEVSPDRVKIYYLPWMHLQWADNSVIPN